MFWLVDAAGDTGSKIVAFALAHVPKKSKNCRFTTGARAERVALLATLPEWQLSWRQHFLGATFPGGNIAFRQHCQNDNILQMYYSLLKCTFVDGSGMYYSFA